MESPPAWEVRSDQGESPGLLPGRRLRYRQKVATLAYLSLDHGNGGIIRDLSEAGLAVQAVSRLQADQAVHLRLDLLRPRLRVETAARVCWADSQGQAGLEFLNLPPRSRRLLKQWIFIQLLLRAYQATLLGSVFMPAQPAETPAELLFSPAARPAIQLEPEPAAAVAPSAPQVQQHPRTSNDVTLSRYVSRGVDGFVVALAVVLFAVLQENLTHFIPGWPEMLGVTVVAAGVFAGLYWFLFSTWSGATPGTRLARFLWRDAVTEIQPEDRPRFR